MAYARALEAERPDAIFQDSLSRRLAGEAGEGIARAVGDAELIARGIAVRTAVMDELILQKVKRDEVDLILNLAAGLDTRPWRLALPSILRWVDVDLPAILKYKTSVIGSERSACKYESLDADITDSTARARVFEHCGGARRVLVVTEGLLVYLTPAKSQRLPKISTGNPHSCGGSPILPARARWKCCGASGAQYFAVRHSSLVRSTALSFFASLAGGSCYSAPRR